MKDDASRLQHIFEAISRIERYTSGGRAAVERYELVQTWIVHNLQIIGEAARKLSPELARAQP